MDANQLPPEFETIEPPTNAESDTEIGNDDAGTVVSILPDVPGYRSIRQLGRGGMGVVILADDLSLERKVAIKLVSHGLSGSKSLRDRFDSEVKTLASLHHQNIAQLYSAGEHNDVPYFVMEFVDGTTLDEHAKEPLNSATSAKLLETLAEAIDYCHSRGVLHRDLKPSNILMTSNHVPKIADFGLAKVLGADSSSTKTGEVLGTPGYMSPEQAGGVVKNLEPSCDVYGLGAILYRLLTGRAPFVASEPFQAVIMVLSEEPIRPRKLVPNISADLETICLKCLEKKPANRYQSAKELQADLLRFLNGEPISARPAGPITKSLKWAKRNLAITTGILAAAVLIIGGIAGLIAHNSSLAKELARSKRLSDHGSEFAKFVAEDHLRSLNEIAGTTSSRTRLVGSVKKFLEDSYDDMPADPLYTRRLGFSYAQLAANIGGIRHNTVGDLEQAEAFYQRALDLYDKALRTSKESEQVSLLKVEAMIESSVIQSRLGKPKVQSELLEKAQSILGQLNPSADSNYFKIQIAGRLIDSKMSQNQFAEALKLLEDLDQQISKLENDEKYKAEMIIQRILSARRKATCVDNLGNSEQAEVYLTNAVKLTRDHAESEPSNAKTMVLLSQTITQLADVLYYQEKYDLARPLYEEALTISESLVKKDADSVDAKYELAVKHSHLAGFYQSVNLLPEAETSIKRAIAINQDLIANGNKEVAISQGLVIDTQTHASICFQQGNVNDAKKLFKQHSDLCQSKLKQNDKNVFFLNQIAENALTQSLMVLTTWLNQEIDPLTVDQAPELKLIDSHLKTGIEYYNRIKEIMPLNSKQQSQLEQLGSIRQVTDETVQKIKASAATETQKVDEPDF